MLKGNEINDLLESTNLMYFLNYNIVNLQRLMLCPANHIQAVRCLSFSCRLIMEKINSHDHVGTCILCCNVDKACPLHRALGAQLTPSRRIENGEDNIKMVCKKCLNFDIDHLYTDDNFCLS